MVNFRLLHHCFCKPGHCTSHTTVQQVVRASFLRSERRNYIAVIPIKFSFLNFLFEIVVHLGTSTRRTRYNAVLSL